MVVSVAVVAVTAVIVSVAVAVVVVVSVFVSRNTGTSVVVGAGNVVIGSSKSDAQLTARSDLRADLMGLPVPYA